ncbi:MAG: glycerophosphodiester phosphodiesterase [Longimicrobiales bacterium]
MPCLPAPPHLIAHRGGAALAPENTLHAFRQSVERWRVDAIELDVRATADGACVVIHDAMLDRTTDGTGRVADLPLAAVREFDAGYRFTSDDGLSYPLRGTGIRVPTFDEVLEALPVTPLIVEVKEEPAQRPLLDAIRRHRAQERVIPAGERAADRTLFVDYPGWTSGSSEQLRRFWLLNRLRLGRFWRPTFETCQVPERHGGMRVVDRRFISGLHRHGVLVHVWTVNDIADMERLLDWGVDGLVTDRPDRLAQMLHRRVDRPLPPGALTNRPPGATGME